MRRFRLTRSREVPGVHYGTPKELWGFSLPAGDGPARTVAMSVLRANAKRLGLDGVLEHLQTTPRVISSIGAWHVVLNQMHLGSRIHRAYVTVHMNRRKEAYLIKNRAVPADMLPARPTVKVSLHRARDIATRSIARDRRGLKVLSHEQMWFPVRTRLHFAHKFRIHRRRPRQEWIVYVDGVSGKVLSKYDNLAAGSGRAYVFDPNPVVALGNWHSLLAADGKPVRRVPVKAYKKVTLRGIGRSGVLTGPRVTTRITKDRLRRPTLNFQCLSHEHGFEEVMVYYHLDQAIRRVESLGYTGRRAIFRRPLAASARATRDDNSRYSPGTRSLSFGTGDVDDAEDGEVILHEFGHALQDAICPDFGQSQEGAAIGEGFGDYFAASFFAGKKRATHKRRLVPAVMTWDGILSGDADEASKPPCVRRVDGRLTYESFDHSKQADEHANGEIWSATLWRIWNAVGRDVADAIVVESHFQLDGFTTFARGARAILDADRNLFRGRHVARLKRIFRRQGIGPVD